MVSPRTKEVVHAGPPADSELWREARLEPSEHAPDASAGVCFGGLADDGPVVVQHGRGGRVAQQLLVREAHGRAARGSGQALHEARREGVLRVHGLREEPDAHLLAVPAPVSWIAVPLRHMGAFRMGVLLHGRGAAPAAAAAE